MLAWAWTLIRLYKEIENSEKLLPNKGVFTLHGSLLAVYLLLYALTDVLIGWANRTEDTNTFNILFGLNDLVLDLLFLLELVTFFLVVKMMLPIT